MPLILSILHWRCRTIELIRAEWRRTGSFNTPLEMPGEEEEKISETETATFNTPLEMHRDGGGATPRRKRKNFFFQYSIGDAPPRGRAWRSAGLPFNTPLEMLGVLVFGFCGFLSFCVGVCVFLVGAC